MMKKQKAEALRLMQMLELSEPIQTAFAAHEDLYVSDIAKQGRTVQTSPATPAEFAIAERFALETGNTPYHMVHSITPQGVLYTIFFSGHCKLPCQKSKFPTALLQDGEYRMTAYCYYAGFFLDRTQPMDNGIGDFESVIIKTSGGGIMRIA